MNYKQIVNIVNDAAIHHNMIYEFNEGDIYEALNSGEHKYPMINLTVLNIAAGTGDTLTLSGTLFYVDRLLLNNSNKLDILAIGIQVLKLIQEKIEDSLGASEIFQETYTPFTEQFADLCAGVFVQFQISYIQELDCDDDFEIRQLIITEDGVYGTTGYDTVVVDVTKVRTIGGKSGDITLGEGLTINDNNVLSTTAKAEWGSITGSITNQTDLVAYVKQQAPNIVEGENIYFTPGEGNSIAVNADDMRYDDSEVKGMIEDVADELDGLNEITIPDELSPTTTNFVEGTTYSIYNAIIRTANLFAGYWNYIKTNITDLIPSTASSTNQLADKSFVNETVAQNAANFRGNWTSWSTVPTDVNLYPLDYAGNRKPTNNDYMVVADASDYDASNDGSWRFLYTGDWDELGKSGWKPAYRIGSAFTDAQQAAIDSTITKEKVDNYDGYDNRIISVETDKRDRIYTANKLYATDAEGKDIALDITTVQAHNYSDLTNKPTINGVEVVGDKTSNDYKIYTKEVAKTGTNIALKANELTTVIATEDVTVSLDTSADLTDGVNEYRLQLAANAPITITFNIVGLKWSYDVPNYLVSGKVYEISIINKHATYLVF